MIKLNSLDSNGNPIIYQYDAGGATWDYGSFAEIITNNAAPPSKVFPLNATAAGGIFDHAIAFTDFANGHISTNSLVLGASNNFWVALDEFVTALTGVLTVDKIYIALTEIEYVGFVEASFKNYSHIGFDVYVSL